MEKVKISTYIHKVLDNAEGKWDDLECVDFVVPKDWLRYKVIEYGFNSLEDFLSSYTYDDTEGIFDEAEKYGFILGFSTGEVEEKQDKIYKVQNYLVKFDLGPVDVNINVYHENQTELTREEILEEAFGYAKNEGIELTEHELAEIETLEKDYQY